VPPSTDASAIGAVTFGAGTLLRRVIDDARGGGRSGSAAHIFRAPSAPGLYAGSRAGTHLAW